MHILFFKSTSSSCLSLMINPRQQSKVLGFRSSKLQSSDQLIRCSGLGTKTLLRNYQDSIETPSISSSRLFGRGGEKFPIFGVNPKSIQQQTIPSDQISTLIPYFILASISGAIVERLPKTVASLDEVNSSTTLENPISPILYRSLCLKMLLDLRSRWMIRWEWSSQVNRGEYREPQYDLFEDANGLLLGDLAPLVNMVSQIAPVAVLQRHNHVLVILILIVDPDHIVTVAHLHHPNLIAYELGPQGLHCQISLLFDGFPVDDFEGDHPTVLLRDCLVDPSEVPDSDQLDAVVVADALPDQVIRFLHIYIIRPEPITNVWGGRREVESGEIDNWVVLQISFSSFFEFFFNSLPSQQQIRKLEQAEEYRTSPLLKIICRQLMQDSNQTLLQQLTSKMGGQQSDGCKIELRKPLKTRCMNKSEMRDFQMKNMIKLKYDYLSNDYFIHTPSIGKGSYGEVFKVTHRQSGIVRAAKKISKTVMYDNSLMKEYEILRQLQHPYIIKIYEIYIEDKYNVIVMDYCGGGQLFRTLIEKRLTENHAAYFMKQILEGVSYCHSRGIIHGDLKPENILLEKDHEGQAQVKIGDFGASRFADEKCEVPFGTRLYRAPEVFHRKASEKCDVWSCGVMLYFMVVGRPPFEFNENTPIVESRTIIEKGEINRTLPCYKYTSDSFKDLVNKMLMLNQDKRLSSAQALKHQWLRQANPKPKIASEEIKQAITNLKIFCQSTEFEILIIFYIWNYMTNPEQRKRLITLFKYLDVDDKGTLGESELLKMRADDLRLAKEDVCRLFKKICKQPKDRLSYVQFITITANKSHILTSENIQTLAKIMDSHKTGKISISQLIQCIGGNRLFFKSIIEQYKGCPCDYFTHKEFIEYLLPH